MISGDYDSILEDNFKEELCWLTEEFEMLFAKRKGVYTDLEKKIARKILSEAKANKINYNSEKIDILFNLTLDTLKHDYPEFF